MAKNKKILGVDPGYKQVGFGIIKSEDDNLEYLSHGCIETSSDLGFSDRLVQINQALKKIVDEYQPDLAAVEELFFCKNVKTAIDVGQARGVILLSLAEQNFPIREFTPKEIKKSLTGSGNAKKSQVQEMVKIELGLNKKPTQKDAADALAVAVCAAVYNSF